MDKIKVLNIKKDRWSTLPQWVRDYYDLGYLIFNDEGVKIFDKQYKITEVVTQPKKMELDNG